MKPLIWPTDSPWAILQSQKLDSLDYIGFTKQKPKIWLQSPQWKHNVVQVNQPTA